MKQESKERQALWCHCVQPGRGGDESSEHASGAVSLLVPGIALPPEEQRLRDAVTTHSCLFMFIWKRRVSRAAWAAYGKGNGSQGYN